MNLSKCPSILFCKRGKYQCHLQREKVHLLSLDLLTIIAGTVITAVALNMLTIPAGLLAGGLTGIAQFINHFSPINVGVFYFILNIPLMIAAYKYLGKEI